MFRVNSLAQSVITTDVLVLGGGPAGTWAALSAAKQGARVVLADKGYCGTSGATAPSNTDAWYASHARGSVMIEIVDSDRCIGCDICVKVCPRDVFDSGDDGIAVIARKSDCQTCFLCELYCPVDALYVSPYAELDDEVDTEQLITQNLLGSYTRNMGWHHGLEGRH